VHAHSTRSQSLNRYVAGLQMVLVYSLGLFPRLRRHCLHARLHTPICGVLSSNDAFEFGGIGIRRKIQFRQLPIIVAIFCFWDTIFFRLFSRLES